MDDRTISILKWRKGLKMPPVTLELFPTFDCNQNCVFCPRKHIEKDETGTVLSDKKLLYIIDEASGLGVKKIDIVGGGEPFKRGICIELIKRIKESKMEGYLNTNFSMLQKKDLYSLAEMRWDYIKISLHAPNKKHDLITGNNGTFRKIIKSIKILNSYKRKFRTERPVLEFGPVLCNLNYLFVEDFIKLAHKLGVRNIFFQPLIDYKFLDGNFKLNDKQIDFLSENIEKYESLATRLNINFNLRTLLAHGLIEKSDKRDIKEKNYCYEPWLHMTIWPNGTYSACSFPQINERGILGNHSLNEIWRSPYFKKLRNKVKNGKAPECCRRCVANVVIDNINLKKRLEKVD